MTAVLLASISGCQGCGACLLTCPEHAIRPRADRPGAAALDVLADRCTGCGECVEVCPVDAVELLLRAPAPRRPAPPAPMTTPVTRSEPTA